MIFFSILLRQAIGYIMLILNRRNAFKKVQLSLRLSVCLSFTILQSFCLSRLSLCASFSLSVCLCQCVPYLSVSLKPSVCMCMCVCVFLTDYISLLRYRMSVSLSLCSSVSISLCLPICVCAYLTPSPPHSLLTPSLPSLPL